MCNEVPDLWHRGNTPGFVDRLLNMGRLFDRLIVRSKRPAAVVADTRCAERFEYRYGFSPEIIPYGIDGEFFSQGVSTQKPDKFCVIQPSMISPSKGQLEVLEAVKRLDIGVVFAGYYEPQHPYTAELIQRAASLDAHFTGHINKEDLRELYHTAHVAVFPGKGQGSWLGPFEALATGTPVIVSPNLSCSTIIDAHDLGIVTNNLDNALREVMRNYPRHQQQALKGKEFVLNNLTWDNFGRRFEEALEHTAAT